MTQLAMAAIFTSDGKELISISGDTHTRDFACSPPTFMLSRTCLPFHTPFSLAHAPARSRIHTYIHFLASGTVTDTQVSRKTETETEDSDCTSYRDRDRQRQTWTETETETETDRDRDRDR